MPTIVFGLIAVAWALVGQLFASELSSARDAAQLRDAAIIDKMENSDVDIRREMRQRDEAFANQLAEHAKILQQIQVELARLQERQG